MPGAGFEPAIPASERSQTHALNRAVTGIGRPTVYRNHVTVGILYMFQKKNKTDKQDGFVKDTLGVEVLHV